LAETPVLLRGAADVPAWARRYPWWTVGAASIAGFALAAALRPRRGAGNSSAGAAHTSAAPMKHSSVGGEGANRRSAVLSAIVSVLGGLILEGLRMVLRNAVATAFDPERPR
jgi:hypothetical protein